MKIMPSRSALGYWEVGVDAINVGEMTISNRTAIFDTRSELIFVPQQDLDGYLLALGGMIDSRYGLTIACDTQESISITIAGLSIVLGGSDLVFVQVGDRCMSVVQPAPAALGLGSTQYIFGDAFRQHVYLGLDFETNSLGLALLT